MKTNTLVKHKKLTNLGIGCVSKVLSKSLKVNFGLDDCITTTEKQLIEVDVSKCKTISFSELKAKSFTNSISQENNKVIIGNELREYVGIGWVALRVITEEDLKNYKRVIN